MCYYGAWSVYRPAPFNFTVADIDPLACTHLIYSFAGLHNDTLTIVSLDTEEDIVKGEDAGYAQKYLCVMYKIFMNGLCS